MRRNQARDPRRETCREFSEAPATGTQGAADLLTHLRLRAAVAWESHGMGITASPGNAGGYAGGPSLRANRLTEEWWAIRQARRLSLHRSQGAIAGYHFWCRIGASVALAGRSSTFADFSVSSMSRAGGRR